MSSEHLFASGGHESRPVMPMSGLSARSLIIGALAGVFVSFVTTWAEYVIGRIQVGVLTLPPAALGTLLILVLANRLIRRVRPSLALQPSELLVVYMMMAVSATTASHGLPPRLMGLLTSINYYASPSNHWDTVFFPHISRYLVPWNPDEGALQPIIVNMYDGLHDGEPIPWLSWVGPLLCWAVVALLVYGAFLCLATLLRPQWSDREKLSFPLAQLPIEMLQAESGGSFYRNRLLWLGAAIPVIIHLINLGHNINPDVPQIVLKWDLRPLLFPSPPLNGLDYLAVLVSFSAIGFFYLLPTELLFSFWFFFLVVTRGSQALLLWLAVPYTPANHTTASLYLMSAEAGGFVVLAGYYLYLARGIVSASMRKHDGEQEMMSYRAALAGLVIFIIGAVLWFWLVGLSLWLAAMEMILYVLVVSLVMARATAEGGMLMTEIIFMPIDFYGIFGRRQLLGAKQLTNVVFATVPFAGDARGLSLQTMMDGQKIGDAIGVKRRSLHLTFWAAMLVALAAGFSIHLWLNYRQGTLSLYPQFVDATLGMFREHAAFLGGEEIRDAGTPISFFLGAAFTVFLAYMRLQYWWWPFHPLAFALCSSWSLAVYWFACLVAWLVKSIVVHYGGLSGYRKARPFFLGLIFGEMSAAVILTLVDAVFHIPAPYIAFNA